MLVQCLLPYDSSMSIKIAVCTVFRPLGKSLDRPKLAHVNVNYATIVVRDLTIRDDVPRNSGEMQRTMIEELSAVKTSSCGN